MTDRRWAWAEVDLGAIGRNIRTLKGRTAPGTLFMAVVKADGYGHGAVEVARAAESAGADRLGVATIDEAIELRGAGVGMPIQVLSEPPHTTVRTLIEYDIVPALYNRAFAVAYSRAAAIARTGARFHLKIDTGMNRIGVRAEEAADFVESLSGLPGLEMEGVFTHFATADVPGDWEFERQPERFSSALEAMRARRIDLGIAHAANSPATILHPETHFDMVRCGIAIYGLHTDAATKGEVELEPAMSVKARVSRVARLAMGDGVSYGFTWHASAPTTVATLPIGYADGVRRVLSNEMRVLIGGHECRQVGRVCMDQIMVEVPRGASASVGDEAVLVGRQGRASIAMDEQAKAAATINHEIACGYGLRLERRYTTS